MPNGFRIKMNLSSVTYNATRDIEKYSAKKRGEIQDVIEDGTKTVYDDALRAAPYGHTGNLKAGIGMSVRKGMEAFGEVYSNAPHSHLVEFGTHPRITYPKKKKALKFRDGGFARGYIRAGSMSKKPFMRPAADKNKPRIEAEMERVLKRD